jgi:hypothetical protein
MSYNSQNATAKKRKTAGNKSNAKPVYIWVDSDEGSDLRYVLKKQRAGGEVQMRMRTEKS